MKEIRVIVIGSNPSQKSPDCTGFHIATRSRITVERWFDGIGCQISYTNISNQKTENNRPLTNKQIKDNLPRLKSELEGYDKIITLGDTASRALDALNILHFKVWHPSGLCRKWNDKEAARLKIEELRNYIQK